MYKVIIWGFEYILDGKQLSFAKLDFGNSIEEMYSLVISMLPQLYPKAPQRKVNNSSKSGNIFFLSSDISVSKTVCQNFGNGDKNKKNKTDRSNKIIYI